MSKSKVATKPQLILGLVSMASGLALVIAIMTETSLSLSLLILGTFAAFTFAFKWWRSSAQERLILREKVSIAIVAGFIATLGYDLSRLLLVVLGDFHISPFKAFPLFGYLILGENISETAAYMMGTVYHFLNGVMFTVAYCFIWGQRGISFGILWAMILEVSMFTLYPTWLDLQAVMMEFTLVSITGHLVYGTIIGFLCRRWLLIKQRQRQARLISDNNIDEVS